MSKLRLLSIKINELFSTDQDFHAEQQNDGRYLKKAGKIVASRIEHMLDSGSSIAVYQRNINDRVKWICYDFDIIKSQLETDNRFIADAELKSAVAKFCAFLDKKEIKYLIEYSGNRGIHIWITFKNEITFKVSHEITTLILEQAELNYNSDLIAIDLFPHSNKITNSVGSCVKLPLSKHKKSGIYSYFLETYNDIKNINKY
uniref:TOTE conflict system archaeo-eukaryotic primase domain-containing protein n=1 Tax=Pantoea ananas TaxID=553 RepID=UPI0018EEE402